ncbi:LytR C-terminal domain-containing protein [Microbacterium sp. gxy059]|uniref:LytR C-terminal domain-containing protein n=1 Tax=Microbacterium sp. gxy059 TaxID=2957199 RepID=UPI003D96476D
MSEPTFPRDRFDDLPHDPDRVGAHRAPRPRYGWVVALLWWLLAVAVLTGAGILAFIVMSQNDVPLPVSRPTQEAPAEVEPVVDPSIPVLLFNGAGDEVTLDGMEEQLYAEGWADADVLTAVDDRDIPATSVFYISEDQEAAARGVAQVLGIESVVLDPEFASVNSDGVTVLVGLDRCDAPAE